MSNYERLHSVLNQVRAESARRQRVMQATIDSLKKQIEDLQTARPIVAPATSYPGGKTAFLQGVDTGFGLNDNAVETDGHEILSVSTAESAPSPSTLEQLPASPPEPPGPESPTEQVSRKKAPTRSSTFGSSARGAAGSGWYDNHVTRQQRANELAANLQSKIQGSELHAQIPHAHSPVTRKDTSVKSAQNRAILRAREKTAFTRRKSLSKDGESGHLVGKKLMSKLSGPFAGNFTRGAED